MRERHHIRAVGRGEEHHAVPGETDASHVGDVNSEHESDHDSDNNDDEWGSQYRPDFASPSTGNWRDYVIPVFALLLVAAWTAVFAISRFDAVPAASLAQWTRWVGEWAMPVLLIIAAWLLWMRSSTRETGRFNDAAHALAEQSRLLEHRLGTVNRELSLAREFLTAETRELEYLGRSASERLSEHAERLQNLVRDNSAEIEAIAEVSQAALRNMARLRDDLPVVANSARDVASNIGHAGHEAQSNVDDLADRLEQLTALGTRSSAQVGLVNDEIARALTEFEAHAEQLGSIAEQRFAVMAQRGEEFRQELDAREVEALAAMHRRSNMLADDVAKLSDSLAETEAAALESLSGRINSIETELGELGIAIREEESRATEGWETRVEQMRGQLKGALADLERRRSEAIEHEEAAIRSLHEKLESLDTDMATRREQQIAQTVMLTEHSEGIAERMDSMGVQMDAIAERGQKAGEVLNRQIEVLRNDLAETDQLMSATEGSLDSATNGSVRLLELIRAVAQHSRNEIPEAIGAAEARFDELERKGSDIRAIIGEAHDRSDALAALVKDIDTNATGAHSRLDDWFTRLEGERTSLSAHLEGLHSELSMLGDELSVLTERSRSELLDAVKEAGSDLGRMVEALASEQDEQMSALIARLGERSRAAIGDAVDESGKEAIEQLSDAANRAAASGRETVIQLRDQLVRINELTGNLEQRVAQARDKAADDVDGDFSRRVTLLTEALNSTAIDIDNLLSTEVSETAWASYLKGDRGIFTRRAVQLLNKREAREIADLYQGDSEFREQVSRYIHDFEFMLRSILATRNGNALAVTILSSDMGKLYVALAQAIERLRN